MKETIVVLADNDFKAIINNVEEFKKKTNEHDEHRNGRNMKKDQMESWS